MAEGEVHRAVAEAVEAPRALEEAEEEAAEGAEEEALRQFQQELRLLVPLPRLPHHQGHQPQEGPLSQRLASTTPTWRKKCSPSSRRRSPWTGWSPEEPFSTQSVSHSQDGQGPHMWGSFKQIHIIPSL